MGLPRSVGANSSACELRKPHRRSVSLALSSSNMSLLDTLRAMPAFPAASLTTVAMDIRGRRFDVESLGDLRRPCGIDIDCSSPSGPGDPTLPTSPNVTGVVAMLAASTPGNVTRFYSGHCGHFLKNSKKRWRSDPNRRWRARTRLFLTKEVGSTNDSLFLYEPPLLLTPEKRPAALAIFCEETQLLAHCLAFWSRNALYRERIPTTGIRL